MTKIWDANDFVVKDAPKTISYISNFLNENESIEILEEIETSPNQNWIKIDGRYKQDWNYQVDSQENLTSNHELPMWVPKIYRSFMSIKNAFPSNHQTNFMRVNKYLPGQGITPHIDSRANNLNVLISLGSTTLLDFYEPKNENDSPQKYIGSMWLEPKSLLILSDYVYTTLLHGIEPKYDDFITDKVFNRPNNLPLNIQIPREIRYSLTFGWYSKFDKQY